LLPTDVQIGGVAGQQAHGLAKFAVYTSMSGNSHLSGHQVLQGAQAVGFLTWGLI
jgi:hypothetical protein